jgi:hypothetical protein
LIRDGVYLEKVHATIEVSWAKGGEVRGMEREEERD